MERMKLEDDAQRALPERRMDERPTHGGEGNHPKLEAEAQDKPAETKLEAGAEDKPAGAGKKKTKMVRVSPLHIRALQVCYPPDRKPYPAIPEETLKLMDPEMQADTRAHTAEVISAYAKAEEEDMAILKQYYEKGYAEMEVPEDEDDEAYDSY